MKLKFVQVPEKWFNPAQNLLGFFLLQILQNYQMMMNANAKIDSHANKNLFCSKLDDASWGKLLDRDGPALRIQSRMC